MLVRRQIGQQEWSLCGGDNVGHVDGDHYRGRSCGHLWCSDCRFAIALVNTLGRATARAPAGQYFGSVRCDNLRPVFAFVCCVCLELRDKERVKGQKVCLDWLISSR